MDVFICIQWILFHDIAFNLLWTKTMTTRSQVWIQMKVCIFLSMRGSLIWGQWSFTSFCVSDTSDYHSINSVLFLIRSAPTCQWYPIVLVFSQTEMTDFSCFWRWNLHCERNSDTSVGFVRFGVSHQIRIWWICGLSGVVTTERSSPVLRARHVAEVKVVSIG